MERRVKQAALAADYDGEPMYRCPNGSLHFERRESLRAGYDARTESEVKEACDRAWRLYYEEQIGLAGYRAKEKR